MFHVQPGSRANRPARVDNHHTGPIVPVGSRPSRVMFSHTPGFRTPVGTRRSHSRVGAPFSCWGSSPRNRTYVSLSGRCRPVVASGIVAIIVGIALTLFSILAVSVSFGLFIGILAAGTLVAAGGISTAAYGAVNRR